jgi:hypothetical protein
MFTDTGRMMESFLRKVEAWIGNTRHRDGEP